jgi:hypothetical protein
MHCAGIVTQPGSDEDLDRRQSKNRSTWMVEPLLVDRGETLTATSLHFLDNDTTTNIVVSWLTAVVALARDIN